MRNISGRHHAENIIEITSDECHDKTPGGSGLIEQSERRRGGPRFRERRERSGHNRADFQTILTRKGLDKNLHGFELLELSLQYRCRCECKEGRE